ncbi:hypothetical protein HK097_007100 [Rhizophlyctis rosea]|uniref:Clavaminate synthase-like protein n=1 Tax=Rhizophlyctis rosea TaxID=64517 RepID=A0AAD5SC37_9FUNG|nr:hypothetical protein HK097_007100 [Rhizophlyctis rosea]
MSRALRCSRILSQRSCTKTLKRHNHHKPTLQQSQTSLTLTWPEPTKTPSKFHYTWLRDNCQCPQCIHPSNRQKLHSSGDISSSAHPDSIELLDNPSGKQLKIVWPESSMRPPRPGVIGAGRQIGKHTSTYDLAWLDYRSYSKSHMQARYAALEPTMWNQSSYGKARKDVTYDDVMNQSDPTGFRSALEQLSHYGLCFIKGVPTNDRQVEELAKRFGCIRETFYGTSWDVKSVPEAKNIAYTSLPLGLHMDLLYFEAPPGLQFLHCLRNTVKGGHSIFVDSYRAIQHLKTHHPKDFETLTRVPVTFHYQNDNHHFHFRRPTIIPNDLNEYWQVYYAPPFQGPMECEEGDVEAFYEAFRRFSDLMNDPELVYTTLLGEGDCVVFANRRVLHGRTEFDAGSGERHLKGTYVDWDDFKDRARVYGVGKVRV